VQSFVSVWPVCVTFLSPISRFGVNFEQFWRFSGVHLQKIGIFHRSLDGQHLSDGQTAFVASALY
jgi:hypothetical protein